MSENTSFFSAGRGVHFRQSAAITRASAFRDSVVSVASVVGDRIERGTVLGATLNTLCNVMGAGVLSLPYALHNGSVGVSVTLMVLCAIASSFSAYVIVVACDATGKFSYNEVLAYSLFPPTSLKQWNALHPPRSNQSTPAKRPITTTEVDIEEDDPYMVYHKMESKKLLRRKATMVFMEVLIVLLNYCAIIVYARVIADSIPPVIHNFLGGEGLWINQYAWLIGSGIIFFFLSCARKMDELKWTSLLGFITIFYIVVAVVVRYFTNQNDRFVPDNEEANDIRWFHFSMHTLRATSTFGVAFAYQYNAPYFYAELENHTPKKMMMSVAVAFPIIIICYTAVGIFGYLTYGALVADEEAGGDIVNNYPKDDVVMNIGRLGLFFHFVSVYPIMSVCARRGIHRLLTMAFGPNVCGGAKSSESQHLLPDSQRESAAAVADGMAADESSRLTDTMVRSSSRMSHFTEMDAEAPEDVPMKAIVLEAFFIVSTTCCIAAVVPGIGVVIEVMGVLFGITIMLTAPGLIGYRIWSKRYLGQSYSYFEQNSYHTPSRTLQLLSGALFVMGVTFTTAGSIALIYKWSTGE